MKFFKAGLLKRLIYTSFLYYFQEIFRFSLEKPPFNAILIISKKLRGRAEVARQAHNLEVSGPIPLPATNEFSELVFAQVLFLCPDFRYKKRRLLKPPQRSSLRK